MIYDSFNIATAIRMEASRRGISIKEVLTNCNLSHNLLVSMSKGSMPGVDSIAKIADYFDVSVDYLLGRTSNPGINK